MTVTAVAGQTVSTDLISVYGQDEAEDTDNALGKDAFLKLLVAQLKYQDPLDPSSSAEFIATTAQFTVVEKLEELTAQGAENQQINALTTASALIGKEISVKGTDGELVSAIVRSTELLNGEVTVVTDVGSVTLDQILSIGTPSDSSESDTTTETATAETSTDGTATTDTGITETDVASTESSDTETSSETSSEQSTETTGTDAALTVTSAASKAVADSLDTESTAISMSKLSQFAYAKYGIAASKPTVSNKES